MGQNHADRNVGSNSSCSRKQAGAKHGGAIVIAVEKDQNASASANPSRSELHGSLELSVLEELGPWNPKRMNLNRFPRKQLLRDPPQEDRDGFKVALPLYDACQLGRHSRQRVRKEVWRGRLPGHRIGDQLIHPQ